MTKAQAWLVVALLAGINGHIDPSPFRWFMAGLEAMGFLAAALLVCCTDD